jgi:hypothetical protein
MYSLMLAREIFMSKTIPSFTPLAALLGLVLQLAPACAQQARSFVSRASASAAAMASCSTPAPP